MHMQFMISKHLTSCLYMACSAPCVQKCMPLLKGHPRGDNIKTLNVV